jgi:hypothetical protein
VISHDQFAKALKRQRIVMSNLQINALLNDLLPNPQSGFGVGGVQVWGDERSIKTVREWHHAATATVPSLRRYLTKDAGYFNILTQVRDEGRHDGVFAQNQVSQAIEQFIDAGRARVSFASTELLP